MRHAHVCMRHAHVCMAHAHVCRRVFNTELFLFAKADGFFLADEMVVPMVPSVGPGAGKEIQSPSSFVRTIYLPHTVGECDSDHLSLPGPAEVWAVVKEVRCAK